MALPDVQVVSIRLARVTFVTRRRDLRNSFGTILLHLRDHLSPCLMTKREQTVLVLQGGGALGAYQAGVYEGIAESGLAPNWIAGVSMGAINAALIARVWSTSRSRSRPRNWGFRSTTS
jgi:predicted acylesterase/phospholipase RssA